MRTPSPGPIPYRFALAGGWIDQPFVSRYDPAPPGSMVVVSIEPDQLFMERAGMATSTRRVARTLWPAGFPPDVDRDTLVRELYAAENAETRAPSGSQDMIGLVYPGLSRLDYDARHEDGLFPRSITTTVDDTILSWLENVLHVVPVAPRPSAYDPLGRQALSPDWVRRLGQSGASCWDACCARDLPGLGAAMTESVTCWQTILPDSFTHPSLTADWAVVLSRYQSRYAGATASASGGGYVFVASEASVPGSVPFRIRRR